MPNQAKSQYYHKWADELRDAATIRLSPDNRDTLLCFANDLDELADEAECADQNPPRSPL